MVSGPWPDWSRQSADDEARSAADSFIGPDVA